MPLIVLFSSFFINLIIAVLSDVPIYTGGVASVYLFMLITGLLTLRNTFSFAIGFSFRRKDYFFGTFLMVAFVSFSTTVLLALLSYVENNLTNAWGNELYFFHLPYLNDGNIVIQACVIFSLMFHLYYLGFSISSVHRRFGRYGMMILLIVSLVAGSLISAIITYFHWWQIIFTKVIAYSAFQLSWGIGLLTIFFILVSYFMLRRAAS
jgi:hypothetical protein